MRITLIYPKLSHKEKWHWFPYSLMGMYELLIKNSYEVNIADSRITSEKDIMNLVRESDCVGISVMLGEQLYHGLKWAQKIRSIKSIPIIWGGPVITSLSTIKSEWVDIAVKGYGESVILDIMKDIEKGEFRQVYSKTVTNFSKYPRWRFSHIDIYKYINPATRAMAYFSSYGCNNHCSFCSISKAFPWRPVPMETVLDELSFAVKKYGFKTVILHDAVTFPYDRRLYDFAVGVKNLNINWQTNFRGDDILKMKNETLKMAVESGLNLAIIGVETGSKRLFPILDKNETLEEIAEAVERLAKLAIPICLNFMFCLPTETPQDTKDTIDFFAKLKKGRKNIQPNIHYFAPLPGTELEKFAITYGYKPYQTLEEWAVGRKWSAPHTEWMDRKTQDGITRLVKKHMNPMTRNDFFSFENDVEKK